MKIECKKLSAKALCELEPGSVFGMEGRYYLLADEERLGEQFLVVRLINGHTRYVETSCQVIPFLDSTLLVK